MSFAFVFMLYYAILMHLFYTPFFNVRKWYNCLAWWALVNSVLFIPCIIVSFLQFQQINVHSCRLIFKNIFKTLTKTLIKNVQNIVMNLMTVMCICWLKCGKGVEVAAFSIGTSDHSKLSCQTIWTAFMKAASVETGVNGLWKSGICPLDPNVFWFDVSANRDTRKTSASYIGFPRCDMFTRGLNCIRCWIPRSLACRSKYVVH